MVRIAVASILFLAALALPARADPGRVPGATGGRDETITWSVTPLLQWSVIQSPESDDDLAGFFDQYEFTPNKSSDVPFEIGLRDGELDVLGASETPRLQVRFASPTSNLGVSGSQIDEPFFNQRLIALTRLAGIDLDLRYRRSRTEPLRLLPNTAGAGLRFNDLTRSEDRFYRDRTGFEGEIRVRPEQLSGSGSRGGWGAVLAPVVSVRGGYQSRDGDAQLRFLRDPSNTWFGFTQGLDRNLAQMGAGVVVAPGARFTLALDFDHERLRLDANATTESALGFAPPAAARAIGFIPNSDRYTGTARFNSRLGNRAVVDGGFQISQFEQADGKTPEQRAAGQGDVEVRYYSANTSLDVRLSRDLSINGLVKYDRRENNTPRNTALFNPDNQIVPFVKRWQRFLAGAELELRMPGINRVALGVRYEDVQRDLDFASGALRIFPENAHLDRDTEIITLYGRTALRPVRGLGLNAELGYRWAPETGYAVELNDNVYGELRFSRVIAWRRPVAVSGYLRGSSGENRDFHYVSAQGVNPIGPGVRRSYKRWNVGGGITANYSPLDRLQLFVSLFYGNDDQEATLDVSNFQRYFQNQGLIFAREGSNRLRNEQMNLILGGRYRFNEATDANLQYNFTKAEARYRDASDPLLNGVQESSRVDADIHSIELEIGHQLRTGVRVAAGYRLRIFDDNAPVQESIASVIAPFDRSYRQHTVTIAVTFTSALLSR